MPDYVDPKYKDSVSGNPQYADVKIVRAPQEPTAKKVGDTGTPLTETRMGAVHPFKPKGRK